MYKSGVRCTSACASFLYLAFLLQVVVFADQCEEEEVEKRVDALCSNDEGILLQVTMDFPRATLARTKGTSADGDMVEVSFPEETAMIQLANNAVTRGRANEKLLGHLQIRGHMTNQSAARTGTREEAAKNSDTQASNLSTKALASSVPVAAVKHAVEHVNASPLWGHVYTQALSRNNPLPSRKRSGHEVGTMGRMYMLLIPLGLSLISIFFVLLCVHALDRKGYGRPA